MCGIVGYIGKNDAKQILISGLKKLEYRGYDSAGLALVNKDTLIYAKAVGKVSKLEEKLTPEFDNYHCGIAHTRWATHGEPNEINAHPHFDCYKNIAVVHNGIIENYDTIKKFLLNKGHKFASDTDTEVFAHLVEENYKNDLIEAVILSIREIIGSYAFAIVHKNHPDLLIAAKKGSPLVVGVGESEYFLASDVNALASYTRNIIYVNEEEIVVLNSKSYRFLSFQNKEIEKKAQKIEIDLEQIEKSDYPHFMLKEIFEQPYTISNAIRGRINLEEASVRLDGLDAAIPALKNANLFILSGCGTSWHASLIGEYLISNFVKKPVKVEYASEMRYKNCYIDDSTISFFISQSGETADTIAALREAKRKGSTCLGICNVVNSTIARETSSGVYLHAGAEIGVASTKAFTSQVTVLALISIFIGRLIGKLSFEEAYTHLKEITQLPSKIESILQNANIIENIAEQYYNAKNALFLGRGINYPVALEGALKLKEISYIHAEGYPAAEMKHGPIALIDENMPVFAIATKDFLYDKVLNNIKEVKARKGKVIAIATEDDDQIAENVDQVIYVPKTLPVLSPILNIIPFQLIAYYTAVRKGFDVDKPRNLAKSVTVE
ncbi:MAG: glutamine--fructose-6-phosphate transaminase (isomerizing) [Spirochaetes bacterium]|nr:glutamine--fructose-6-phosphate transaminase (isomerizing) [Spirochaetota bacterium]NLJ04828.1 glutamine--fructose-6-phosphate transaminase (isomerizing) [Exilispira sp.]MBP8990681.1 glutamine--fructose-6-phosphate transaminase (isomerizing) [Spirochaetota bacterium]HOV45438.1 glutamine--fructose-6-phosphate transaminase (isomerizing) [Exilispira sp.]HQM88886.1 glutamine--fructose-6-phosphate transaminase (isomerizing) [Exilispira sp.]